MFHKKSVWLRRYLVCVFRQRQGAQHFLYDMTAVSKFIWWQLLCHTKNTEGADAVMLTYVPLRKAIRAGASLIWNIYAKFVLQKVVVAIFHQKKSCCTNTAALCFS